MASSHSHQLSWSLYFGPECICDWRRIVLICCIFLNFFFSVCTIAEHCLRLAKVKSWSLVILEFLSFWASPCYLKTGLSASSIRSSSVFFSCSLPVAVVVDIWKKKSLENVCEVFQVLPFQMILPEEIVSSTYMSTIFWWDKNVLSKNGKLEPWGGCSNEPFFLRAKSLG